MFSLRMIFVLGTMVLLVVTLARGRWEARLDHSHRSIIGLPIAPVWSGPEVPDYAVFRAAYRHLPPEIPPNATMVRQLRWDKMLVDFALGFWVVALITGVTYSAKRGGTTDQLMHYVLHVGIGMTVAWAACLTLFMAVGGWGPPALGFFAVAGVVGGLVSATLWLPTVRHDNVPFFLPVQPPDEHQTPRDFLAELEKRDA